MAQTSINPETYIPEMTPEEQALAEAAGATYEIAQPEYQAEPGVAIPEREAYQRQRYGSRWATFLSRLAHARAGMQDPTISWEQRQNELAKLHSSEQNEIINRALQQQQSERLRRQELNRQAEQQAGFATEASKQQLGARQAQAQVGDTLSQRRIGRGIEAENTAYSRGLDARKIAVAEQQQKAQAEAAALKQVQSQFEWLAEDLDVQAFANAGLQDQQRMIDDPVKGPKIKLFMETARILQGQRQAPVQTGVQAVQRIAPQQQQEPLIPAQLQQTLQQVDALNIDPVAKELLTEHIQATGSAPTQQVLEAVAAVAKALAEARKAIDQLPVTDASKAARKRVAEMLAREGAPLTMRAIEERTTAELGKVKAFDERAKKAALWREAEQWYKADELRRRGQKEYQPFAPAGYGPGPLR